jgi:hypothetical protein
VSARYDCPLSGFFVRSAVKDHGTRKLIGRRHMRFIIGLIVGAPLTIGGAYIHDHMESGATKPLVSWENASDVTLSAYEYLKAQFDRAVQQDSAPARGGGGEARGRGPGAASVPVTVATVTKRDLPIYLTGLGAVQASATIALRSQVDGKLQEVLFTEGQQIHKGVSSPRSIRASTRRRSIRPRPGRPRTTPCWSRRKKT